MHFLDMKNDVPLDGERSNYPLCDHCTHNENTSIAWVIDYPHLSWNI
jgi:hypothetical protein